MRIPALVDFKYQRHLLSFFFKFQVSKLHFEKSCNQIDFVEAKVVFRAFTANHYNGVFGSGSPLRYCVFGLAIHFFCDSPTINNQQCNIDLTDKNEQDIATQTLLTTYVLRIT